jgi:hypothetical protein
MHRRISLATTAAAAVVAAAPGAAAAAPEWPAFLPAAGRAVSAGPGACATASYRAPMSGHVTARLTGSGDWDLVVRDHGGRTLGASRGFGGREVVQTWVAAGARLVAKACRRARGGRSARVSFVLADAEPPAAPRGTPQLVRVTAPAARLEALERAGFDVTHLRGRDWADVLVSGAGELDRLRRTGLELAVRDPDLAATYRAARRADRDYAARVKRSPLPSGRTGYRTYDEFQAELKQLVADHPGLVRKVVFGRSHQGREISGVEIARDVGAADGRPVYFLMGQHHAREWPSGEAAMEFAHLLVKERSNPRIARILEHERVVILPIVNVDGSVLSRSAFSLADATGQNPALTLVEGVMPPGGFGAYRRKNCNGEILPPSAPCELAWGVDINRNYGNLWGGPGSSSDVTSQSYHGPGPRSEAETQAVWNYARTHHVTTLVSLHNVAALVLRPPGLQDAGLAPDEQRMKEIGDAMGEAAGYTSQYSWQLYDTAGTTEDDTYAATGGFGYTIEMGPPDGQFHMPYETGVVAEWTGDNPHAKGRGGLREALLIAAESAANPADHAVIRGTAPAGKVLRLRKTFDTRTSEYCAKSVELILAVGPQPPCLTGTRPPLTLKDTIDTTTTVPASGRFEWHVGPSTRPFAGGVEHELAVQWTPRATTTGTKEAYELTCEEPGGTVVARRQLVIDRGEQVTVDPCGGAQAAPAASRRAPRRVKVRLRGSRGLRGGRARIEVGCPAKVLAPCTGVVRVRGAIRGRRPVTIASRRFVLAAGASRTYRVRASRAARRTLTRRRRMRVRLVVTGTAGETRLTGSRRLTLRR